MALALDSGLEESLTNVTTGPPCVQISFELDPNDEGVMVEIARELEAQGEMCETLCESITPSKA